MNFQNIESIAVALSVIASLYIFWRTPKYANIKERYENVIFPLFSLLEPYLFKDFSKAPIDKALSLINQNTSYAGSRLNEWAYYLGKNNNQYNYNSFCKQLYYEYDKCSFILGLKIHSLSYRISRKQYQSKFLLVAYLLIHVFALLIAISITLILFTTVLVITQRLLGL